MKRKDSFVGKSISDYKSSVNASRVTIAALAVACAVLAWKSSTVEQEIIVLPFEFNEEIRISGNQANEHFKVRWAWSVAALAGNVERNNAEFVVQQLRLMMSPYLRNQIGPMMFEEARMMQLRGVRQTFVIEDVIYDAAKDLVWVIGQRALHAAGQTERSRRWTYELRIEANNGRPYITHFNTYEGAPRPQDMQEIAPNPFLSDELQQAINAARPGEAIRVPVYTEVQPEQVQNTSKEQP